MKGVILAGGFGTRLNPITKAINKHLIPVYNKPVIYYGVEKLVQAGIDKIIIITSPHHIENFVDLLGSGQDFISLNTGKQIQIVYGIQNEPLGTAEGLWIAKDYVGNDNCVLYFGDNIFEDDISKYVKNFKAGATVFLKEVSDPERFGVAIVDENNLVTNIEEKPINSKSNLAVTGLYIYDNTVFEKMIGQPKSSRGEFEITYINNLYIKEKKLKAVKLIKEWFDVGNFESLLRASKFYSDKYEKNKEKT